MADSHDVRKLLGLRLSSTILSDYIKSLTPTTETATPEVKSYSDAVYLNYFGLGLSLLFAPQNGYKPTSGSKLLELEPDKLVLDSIDIYNAPPANSADPASDNARSRKAQPTFATFVELPLALTLTRDVKDKAGNVVARPENLVVKADSTGKDIVAVLHEPDRKGGGAGPSTGSIGIWCEWSKDGIMIEFGGQEAKGPQAWERGKDAIWRVLTIFSPGLRP